MKPAKSGHQLVCCDPVAHKGQRTWAEGKLGKITRTNDSRATSGTRWCKIQYDDGSSNKEIAGCWARL